MPKKNLPDQPAASFEQAMEELELLVEKMESGALPKTIRMTARTTTNEHAIRCLG